MPAAQQMWIKWSHFWPNHVDTKICGLGFSTLMDIDLGATVAEKLDTLTPNP